MTDEQLAEKLYARYWGHTHDGLKSSETYLEWVAMAELARALLSPAAPAEARKVVQIVATHDGALIGLVNDGSLVEMGSRGWKLHTDAALPIPARVETAGAA